MIWCKPIDWSEELVEYCLKRVNFIKTINRIHSSTLVERFSLIESRVHTLFNATLQ